METLHRRMESHVIAYANAAPQVLATVLPLSPDAIPELINYVFLTHCRTREQVQDMAHGTPALLVRGPRVVAHARRLIAVYTARFGEGAVRVDEDVCLALGRLAGVPQSILDYAIIPQTDEEADELVERFRQRRSGYTRAPFSSEEGVCRYADKGR